MTKNRSIKRPGAKGSKRLSLESAPTSVNYDLCKPVFSFQFMKYGGKQCLSNCDRPNKASIAEKILQISQLSWKEITSTQKQSLGYEKIPRKQFIVPIPASVTPDVSKLITFRFSGAARMAGFRRADVYHIVLVSQKHNLYR